MILKVQFNVMQLILLKPYNFFDFQKTTENITFTLHLHI